MAGRFRHIESMFKVQGPINEFPICLCSPGKPGLTTVIVHGGKGFSYYWIGCGGQGDFVGEGNINGMDVEILISSLQEGDLPVIITSFDLVLP